MKAGFPAAVMDLRDHAFDAGAAGVRKQLRIR
jgi:hypothetical protein